MPDTSTEAIYLTPDGHYYVQKCKIPQGRVPLAINPHGEGHILSERPVFPKVKMGRVKNWGEVVNLKGEPQQKIHEKTQLIVEPGSSFPVSTNPTPSIASRHHAFIRFYEGQLQTAQVSASRSDMDNRWSGPVAIICASIAGLVAVIMALVWLVNSKNAAGLEPVVGMMSLGIAVTWPMRRAAVPRVVPIYHETLYLVCELTSRIYILDAPYALLAGNLSHDSRFVPYVPDFRKRGLLLGGLLSSGLGVGLLSLLMPPAFAAVIGPLLFVWPGMGIGWKLGPMLAARALPPIWVAYRTGYIMEEMTEWLKNQVVGVESEELTDLTDPVITGYQYTQGCGMDPDLFELQVEAYMNAGRNPDDDQPQDGQGDTIMTTALPAKNFTPLMFNSRFVHDKVQSRDEKDHFRGGLSRGQKLEIGGVLVLAGVAILVMFMVVMGGGGG